MGLGVLTPVLERVQQLRIHSSQPSEVFGMQFVTLALVGVDEPYLAGIGHQNLVAQLLQQPANPRRMGAHLDGYAQLLLRVKALLEGFGGGTQSTFFEHFTALDIQKTQVSVVVSEI